MPEYRSGTRWCSLYASARGGFTNAEKDVSFEEVYRAVTMKVPSGETVDG